MKLLAILAAGLSIAFVSSSYDKLRVPAEGRGLVRRIPGKGSGSAPVDKSGNVPRPKAAEVKNPPPGRGGDKPFKEEEAILDSLRQEPKYEKGYDFVLKKNPSRGATGYYHDADHKVVEIYYGDKAPRHAVNVEWNNLANALPPSRPITLKPASTPEKKEQRRNALRYLRKNPRIVLNEKPAASLSHDRW